jgi:hypothetical protein
MTQYYVPTRYPTRTGMGPNLSLYDETLTTNSLNYGTAWSMVPSDWFYQVHAQTLNLSFLH